MNIARRFEFVSMVLLKGLLLTFLLTGAGLAAVRDINGVLSIVQGPTDCSLEQALVYIPGQPYITKLDHTGLFRLTGVPVSRTPYTLRIEVPGATQKFFDRPVTVVSRPKVQVTIPVDSVCPQKAICGDSTILVPEGCDDGNTSNGDGCSASCAVEAGFQCNGQPSVCVSVCGDAQVANSESCDDGNTTSGDGCSSVCAVETGFSCSGSPSVCTSICGDGILGAGESCDDANTTNGDGCSSACTVETGYQCMGAPSFCSPICGDGIVTSPEQCDDSNTVNGDGCSAMCRFE